MRQRPGWTFPERWLPVADIARTRAFAPAPPWRLIAVALVLIALVLAALVVVGSQRKVAPPFGPARNGEIVYDSAGDLYVGDPETGASRLLVGGPEVDSCAWLLARRDPGRLLPRRGRGRPDFVDIMAVNADGSGRPDGHAGAHSDEPPGPTGRRTAGTLRSSTSARGLAASNSSTWTAGKLRFGWRPTWTSTRLPSARLTGRRSPSGRTSTARSACTSIESRRERPADHPGADRLARHGSATPNNMVYSARRDTALLPELRSGSGRTSRRAAASCWVVNADGTGASSLRGTVPVGMDRRAHRVARRPVGRLLVRPRVLR